MSALFHFKEQLAFKLIRYLPNWVTPQLLSWLRLMLVIPLLLLLQNQNKPAALVVFVLAAFLDYIDGPLARATDRVTTLGKLLDPLADKIIALPVIYFLGQTFLTSRLITIIIGLEVVLVVMSLVLKPLFERLGQKRSLGANIYGKYKFSLQVMLILYMFLLPANPSTQLMAQGLSYITIALSVASIIKHLLPETHDQNQINT